MTSPPEKYWSPRFILAIGAVAAIAMAIVGFLYTRQFGFQLATSNQLWAEFGDYFGGVLGPILSFLGLLAILFTVVLQGRQLQISADTAADQFDYFRREQLRTDTYRLIEILAARVTLLSNEKLLEGNLSLRWVADNVDISSAQEKIEKVQQAAKQPKTSTYQTIKSIERDLELLELYFNQYDELSSTPEAKTPVPGFFRVEFGLMIWALHRKDLIDKDVYAIYCVKGHL